MSVDATLTPTQEAERRQAREDYKGARFSLRVRREWRFDASRGAEARWIRLYFRITRLPVGK